MYVFNQSGSVACRPHKSSDEEQPERHCSLLWRRDRRTRRQLEERQPQIAHFDKEAVERRLVTDGTGKQGRAIALVRDREVLKPLLPEGVQVSLHPNDISHTLVLPSDDVSSSKKKDTLRAGGTQSPKGYQKDTFESGEEQPGEGSQKDTMHDGLHRRDPGHAAPLGDARGGRSEQRERACPCNGLRAIRCSQLAQDTGDMFLGGGERDHQLPGNLLVGGALGQQL